MVAPIEARAVLKDDTKRGIASVKGGLRGLSQSASIVQGPLGGVAGRIGSLNSALGSFNPAVIAAGVGIAGLSLALKEGVAEYAEFERQNLRLESLLKATGNASGFTGRQLQDMAVRLDESTLASEKGAKDAIGALLTFKSVAGSTFERTINVAQDLSEVLGQDLRQSTVQLGKALEDPATGLNALRRSGVSFTDEWRTMILNMVNSGKQVEAQRLILAELEKQVGGAGKAAAGGLAGSIDTLSLRWTQFKKNIGNSKVIKTAIDDLAGGLERLNNALSPTDLSERNELLERWQRIQFRLNKQNEYGGQLSAEAVRRLKREAAELEIQIRLKNANLTLQQREADEAAAIADKKAEQAALAKKQAADAKAAHEAEIQANKEKLKQLADEDKARLKLLETQRRQAFTTGVSRVDQLRNEGKSELELLNEQFAQKKTFLQTADDDFFQNRAERDLLLEQLEDRHQQKLTEIAKREADKQSAFEEMIWNKKMQAAQEGFASLLVLSQGQSKSLFRVAQLGASATALVSAYKAYNEALAGPPGPPWSYGIAAAALLKGLASVKQINSTKFGATGGGGIPGGGGSVGGIGTVGTQPTIPQITQPKRSNITIVGARPGLMVDSATVAEAFKAAADSDEIIINVNGERADIF